MAEPQSHFLSFQCVSSPEAGQKMIISPKNLDEKDVFGVQESLHITVHNCTYINCRVNRVVYIVWYKTGICGLR